MVNELENKGKIEKIIMYVLLILQSVDVDDIDELGKRRYNEDEHVVGQNFLVRLYELDIHQKASLEALLNYTQVLVTLTLTAFIDR